MDHAGTKTTDALESGSTVVVAGAVITALLGGGSFSTFGYSVLATTPNRTIAATDLRRLDLEIDPGVPGSATVSNLVSTPSGT